MLKELGLIPGRQKAERSASGPCLSSLAEAMAYKWLRKAV